MAKTQPWSASVSYLLFLTIPLRPHNIKICWDDIRQIFRIGTTMAVVDQFEIRFSIGLCRYHGRAANFVRFIQRTYFCHAVVSSAARRANVGLLSATTLQTASPSCSVMCCFTTNFSFSLVVKEFLKLVKIWHSYGKNGWFFMLPIRLVLFPQRSRTRQISKTTCVWRTEIVTNCCYVNRQIYLILFSTNIKLLKTSFDLLTDRLTLSVTDQLLIIYGILLRHLFLCCSSCVQWVMWF